MFTAAGLAALFLLGGVPADAQDTAPDGKPEAAPRAPEPAGKQFALATNSRLPFPPDADRWVDAISTQPAIVSVPGAGDVTIRKQAVLVYRPAGNAMRWEDLVEQHAAAGLLSPTAQPRLQLSKLPETEADAGNAYEDRIYSTGVPGEHVTLGMVRNMRSQHLLVYSVLLHSKFDDASALLYSRATASRLGEQARRRRIATPVPPGAVAGGSVIRFQGVQLRQLQVSLTGDRTVSPTVRRMAEVIFPQATAVTRSVWRTAAPMTDRALIDYYVGEARRLGWGAPASTDETQPGKPTLLFQRPYGGGVVLLRAQPTPATTPGALVRPSTTIIVLEVEGPVSLAALLAR